jgi:hypothetical protein
MPRVATLRRVLAIAVFLGSLGAQAGGVFVETFEGPTFDVADTPPGLWSSFDRRAMVNDLVTAAALHRGDAGLRVSDQATTAAGGGDMTAWYGTLSPLTSQAHLRFWFRLASSNDQGAIVIGELLQSSFGALCDVQVRNPGGLLSVAGRNVGPTFSDVDSGVRLAVGAWHLLECGVRGLGTTNGERLLAFDGQLVAREAGLDFSGLSVDSVAIGEPYAVAYSFGGQLDFDDVRVGNTPNASRLAIDAGPGPLVAGDCVPLVLSVLDSEGAPSALPFEVLPSSTALQVQLFADPVCQTSAFPVRIPAGVAVLPLWMKPTRNSPASIELSFVDVFPALEAWVVVPAGVVDAGVVDAGVQEAVDAGELPPPRVYPVGCGCGADGAALGLWLVLLSTARRRS